MEVFNPENALLIVAVSSDSLRASNRAEYCGFLPFPALSVELDHPECELICKLFTGGALEFARDWDCRVKDLHFRGWQPPPSETDRSAGGTTRGSFGFSFGSIRIFPSRFLEGMDISTSVWSAFHE
jgi:hypothetical protein